MVVNTRSDMFVPASSYEVRALAKMRCFNGVEMLLYELYSDEAIINGNNR